jgi:hypothetical protein
MKLRPIALARAHHCAASIHSGSRSARVGATPEADLRGGRETREIPDAQVCAVGKNAEPAK